MAKKIIFIVGPTGVGKSDVGFLLAKQMRGEIVSCDAMQVYREVNIACDKPSPEMRLEVIHHLLDIVSVTEVFDVAKYRQLAVAAIEDILGRGELPVVVGGSGMYVSVLLDGIFETSAADATLRQALEEQAAKPEGLSLLYQELLDKDPATAAKLHRHDAKRIIRAVEVLRQEKRPISVVKQQREGLWGKYDITIYGLNRERDILYRRVEARIERMFQQGLVDEIKMLQQMPLSRTAATLIGIPEVTGYLKGEYDLERAKYLMKRNTRHFVKRQLTWFRRDKRIQWIEMADKAPAGLF